MLYFRSKQECIPVGCIPSAAVAVSPAMYAPPHMPPAMHATCYACSPCHACSPPAHAPPATHAPCHACPLLCMAPCHIHPLPCMHPATHTPPLPRSPPSPWTELQTLVKTLPFPTTVADGGNPVIAFCYSSY